jgi:hypothetical protein
MFSISRAIVDSGQVNDFSSGILGGSRNLCRTRSVMSAALQLNCGVKPSDSVD